MYFQVPRSPATNPRVHADLIPHPHCSVRVYMHAERQQAIPTSHQGQLASTLSPTTSHLHICNPAMRIYYQDETRLLTTARYQPTHPLIFQCPATCFLLASSPACRSPLANAPTFPPRRLRRSRAYMYARGMLGALGVRAYSPNLFSTSTYATAKREGKSLVCFYSCFSLHKSTSTRVAAR